MPLNKGCSRKAFQENVRLLLEEGKPERQAVAIAYRVQQKHCGTWLFVYGWASPKQLVSWLGLSKSDEDREVKEAEAPNYRLAFYGSKGKPGVARRNGDRALGFLMWVEPGDVVKIMDKLGKGWTQKTISVRSGRSQPFLAQTLVPTARTEVQETNAMLRKAYKSMDYFWDVKVGTF